MGSGGHGLADLGVAQRNRSPLGRGPGDPLGSFQSLGKNLAPQGETSPSRRRAAKKFNDKFQFIVHRKE